MTIHISTNIGILPSRKDSKNSYVITKLDINRVVWNGEFAIFVITLKGRHLLNVQYRRKWYGCSLDGLTDDQAALAAAPFFEAVKAGHDSFEVQA